MRGGGCTPGVMMPAGGVPSDTEIPDCEYSSGVNDC